MHRGTWKRKEREAAEIFGCRRNVLSGGSGRDDRSQSDATHKRLFIEVKARQAHQVRTLWEATKALAAKEGKTPVVILYDKSRHGCLLVVHEKDAKTAITEWLVAQPAEIVDEIERDVRELRLEGK